MEDVSEVPQWLIVLFGSTGIFFFVYFCIYFFKENWEGRNWYRGGVKEDEKVGKDDREIHEERRR